MSNEVNTVPPVEWIPGAIVSIIITFINLTILKNEIAKRRLPDSTFTTKSLQYSSLISIIAAFISNLLLSLHEIDGFCNFSRFLSHFMFATQYLFMGFYQLSRLYYCFSNDKIHSNKGYPKWVFIIMIIFGVSLSINWVLTMHTYTGYSLNNKCGINSRFEFYYDRFTIFSFKNTIIISWFLASNISWLLWDFTTLMLYYCKIRTFRDVIASKDQSEVVYKRILSVLYHIFILTIFYEVFTNVVGPILSAILRAVIEIEWITNLTDVVAISIASMAINISMYLMMDHNKSDYIRFLRMISKLKLNCICCGCRHIVKEQLLELDVKQVIKKRKESNYVTELHTHHDHGLPHKIEADQDPALISQLTTDLGV